jgi:hypothetical protein
MAIRIKDFSKFQHFKDRSPPWVKLYRDILDDPDWHELDGDSAKILVMLWLIASEDETKQGLLPDDRKLRFRLRITEKALEHALTKLSHWLERADIAVISDRYQLDAPERAGEETEESRGETEDCSPSASESADDGFATFWREYPRKVAKPQALKAWKKIKPASHIFADLMAGLERQKAGEQWQKDGGQFIPHPATWLNARRWEDEQPLAVAGHAPLPDFMRGAL